MSLVVHRYPINSDDDDDDDDDDSRRLLLLKSILIYVGISTRKYVDPN
jgi:hypothetical protein